MSTTDAPLIDGQDSTIISNLSRDTGAVICYSDRRYKNDGEARLRFPHLAAAGRIIALAAAVEPPDSPLAGDGVDTEPGNLPAGAAAASLKARIQAGHWRPVGYADLSDMRNLISDLHMLGIPTPAPGPGRPVRLISAHPTGRRHICGPATCGFPVEMDGTQWWWSSLQNPGGLDLDLDVFREDCFIPKTPNPPEGVTVAQLIDYEVATKAVGLALLTDKGEVLHIEQQNPTGSGQNSDWWRDANGHYNWLSLGSPGK